MDGKPGPRTQIVGEKGKPSVMPNPSERPGHGGKTSLRLKLGPNDSTRTLVLHDDDDDKVPKPATKILDLTTGPYLGAVPTSPIKQPGRYLIQRGIG